MPEWLIYLIALVGIIAAFVLWMVAPLLTLYVQAKLSDAHVSMFELIGMRLRKVDVRTVVFSRIRSVKAQLDVPTEALETHALAGGNVGKVISALIAAQKAKIELPWDQAAAWDLAGEDVMAYIKEVVEKDSREEIRTNWRERIEVDAVTGQARFRRSQAGVVDVLESLAAGRSTGAVLMMHGIEAEDLCAAFACAAAAVREPAAVSRG
jgi:uncharacterized protein YqfA (UPF0365 family)